MTIPFLYLQSIQKFQGKGVFVQSMVTEFRFQCPRYDFCDPCQPHHEKDLADCFQLSLRTGIPRLAALLRPYAATHVIQKQSEKDQVHAQQWRIDDVKVPQLWQV